MKLGFYQFTCCGGCMLQICTMRSFIELAGRFEISSFSMIQDTDLESQLDMAFVAGSPVSAEEIIIMKSIRRKSNMLIAVGACAIDGGLNTVKKDLGVKVDHFIKGCPIDSSDFTDHITRLLSAKRPIGRNLPVCAECRENGNKCMLISGEPCEGPITEGGCKAVCLGRSTPCISCRGKSADADLAALKKISSGDSIMGVKNAASASSASKG